MPTPAPTWVRDPVAVLVSGGLDSAILLAEALRTAPAVYPLYVRTGLYWETAELQHLHRFLEAIARLPSSPSARYSGGEGLHREALRPLHILALPVDDLYGPHWSLTGQNVPDENSPDAAVYLPGRNVLLLAKALIWCQLNGVPAVALAPLEGNPFPDATPAFFEAYQDAVNRAIGGSVRVLRPYAGMDKRAVLLRGHGLPLEWTFSCMRPIEGKHCGCCNKCAERRRAFRAAGVLDATVYHAEDSCIA